MNETSVTRLRRTRRRSRAPRGQNWVVTPNKFLSADQVQQLRDQLEGERRAAILAGTKKAVRDASIIETLLGTGLRVSELCHLVVGDLYLDAGHVLVRNGKGNKARLVAIGSILAGYLKDFLVWKGAVGEPTDDNSPLFVSQRRGHLGRSAVHRIWKAALKRAGLPTRWGVHATRHSYAVEVYRKTKDLRLTQRQLGHSSPVVTQVYANLVDEDVRKGVELLWAA